MSYQFRDQSTELKSEMNVVPMIDVLLVLLIVFMIASPLISSSVEVNLPQTSIEQASAEQNESSVVVVTIGKDEKIYLTNTGVGIVDELKTPKELVLELTTIKSAQPDSKVFLKADRDSPYRLVMFGLELIKSSGFEDANLVSEERG